MHARSTQVQGDPRSVDEATRHVRDEVMPEVSRLDDYVGLSMLVDPGTGRCIITTSWRHEAAMRANQEAVRSSAERTAEVLGGRAEMQEWEIAAMHRVDDASSASCSRVTWLRTEPGAVDRAVDAVRLSLMPKLEDLPGFCSLSVMVRRVDGLSVAAVAYDGREQLERTAEGAREFREDFAPALGVQVVDSAELDVAIAHLRVPETL